jgi:hypothetical protein
MAEQVTVTEPADDDISDRTTWPTKIIPFRQPERRSQVFRGRGDLFPRLRRELAGGHVPIADLPLPPASSK